MATKALLEYKSTMLRHTKNMYVMPSGRNLAIIILKHTLPCLFCSNILLSKKRRVQIRDLKIVQLAFSNDRVYLRQFLPLAAQPRLIFYLSVLTPNKFRSTGSQFFLYHLLPELMDFYFLHSQLNGAKQVI